MDYHDPDWVAAELGLEKNTVYKYLNDGTLPAIQLGRKWLISEARLRDWLERRTDAQTRARRSVARMTERTIRRMDSFSDAAREAVRAAILEARRYGHGYLGQEHLLLGLVADVDAPVTRWLQAAGATSDSVPLKLKSAFAGVDTAPSMLLRLRRTPRARRAMRQAAQEARTEGRSIIEPGHLLLGLLLVGEGVGHDVLIALGIDAQRVRQLLNATPETQRKEKP